jgi:hypothetical protein
LPSFSNGCGFHPEQELTVLWNRIEKLFLAGQLAQLMEYGSVHNSEYTGLSVTTIFLRQMRPQYPAIFCEFPSAPLRNRL